MSSETLVHLVDDDAAIRDSLKLMLRARGFSVRVYESAAAFLERRARIRSGCVVADVRMPNTTGVELLAKMKGLKIELPVVIITAYADAPLAVQAMKEGASDLLEKPFDDEALLASIRRALATERGELAPDAETRDILARFAALTAQEKDVLAGLSKGRPNTDIAHELGVGVRAIELCRANIMAKTQTGSLAELMRMSLVASAARAVEARADRAL